MMENSLFWIFISFVLLVVLLFSRIKKLSLTTLDKRTDQIRKDLENAQNLREEAQLLVAHHLTQHQNAQKEASRIIQRAKEDALLIEQKSEEDMTFLIKRRQDQAKARIAQIESNVILEIRNEILKVTISASKQLLIQRLSRIDKDPLIDSMIMEIPKHLRKLEDKSLQDDSVGLA